MKILFMTDTHIRGTSPRNRKDNVLDTLKEKLYEVNNLCRKEEVDLVIHGGDIFDRPDVSPSIVRDFSIILKGFNAPIYAVPGNHDIFGHNPDTVYRTMIGILEGAGIINLVRGSTILTLKGKKLLLIGNPYFFDIDRDPKKSSYIVRKNEDVDYTINVVHGMLLDKPFIEGIPYTLIEQIIETGADITLSGHYHSGFGIVKKENKYFVNPGSLLRITNSKKELSRIPQVAIIHLHQGIDIKLVELESALPGDMVLDRTEIELAEYRRAKMADFFAEIDSLSKLTTTDLDKIINSVITDLELKDEVKTEALKRIEEAQIDLTRKGEF